LDLNTEQIGKGGNRQGMKKICAAFRHYEGPTLLVAITVYVGWTALILHHDQIPWPVIFVFGGILAAWHSSVIHESVHNLNSIPKWLKNIIIFPPLGVWYPYAYYVRAHIIHHRDNNLTHPVRDPESYYLTRVRWRQTGTLVKSLLMINQTFAGRMVIGPFISVYRLVAGNIRKVMSGDNRTIKGLVIHGISLAVLFGFVSGVAGMVWWQYLLLVAYPGLMLGLVRSFCEHGAAINPNHRTAIVESGTFFSLLFLYNNLHVVHHQNPSMRWYDIPSYYRDHREEIHRHNGGYVFSGYGDVIRKTLFTPAFLPVHPSS